MAVAFDIGRVGAIVEAVVARAEDCVDVIDVGVSQRQLVERLQLAQHAVVGLFVLPPTDATDEALVVQIDALAASNSAAERMVVAQQRLVDLAAVRVRHCRVVGLAVAGAVVGGITQSTYVVCFDQSRQAVPLAGLKADASAQRLGVGVLECVVLIDVLVAIAQVQNRLSVGEYGAEVFLGKNRRTA